MKKIFFGLFLFLSQSLFASPNNPGIPENQVRTIYSSTNVTTSAWVQIVASTNALTSYIEIFDSSGQTLELGVGSPGNEKVIMIIPPGGLDFTSIFIAQGVRLSLKALSGTANAGESDINFFY